MSRQSRSRAEADALRDKRFRVSVETHNEATLSDGGVVRLVRDHEKTYAHPDRGYRVTIDWVGLSTCYIDPNRLTLEEAQALFARIVIEDGTQFLNWEQFLN